MLEPLPPTRLVTVASALPDPAKLACEHGPPPLLVLDRGGELQRRLRAWWSPRAYLFDAAGKLVYVQPAEALDGDALSQVQALLQRTAGLVNRADARDTMRRPSP